MKTLFADFETYYDGLYSLRKMTPVEYILNPKFEVIGCAFKWGVDGTPFWVDGPDLPAFFQGLTPEVTSLVIVSHNALFDSCIIAWVYGLVPRLTVDTLGVSRAVLGYILKNLSLASVALHLGIGVKGGALPKVKGMGLEAIKAAGLYDEFVAYAINDVELCALIYSKLVQSGRFPAGELLIMDMVLRCAIQPVFELCPDTLAQHYHDVMQEKAALLDKIGVTKEDLMSNEKFAEALRNLGVEPPTKISPTTGKETYAFAKSDTNFLELEEHDDPRVQALVAARFGFKSTIEETRSKRFISISQLEWRGHPVSGQARLMPMPLRFSGAHTHRLSGDWKLNVQNMRRGGKLRYSVKARKGRKVVSVDSSQIEARGVSTWCGAEKLRLQFENKEDVYSSFASKFFGFAVNKSAHPTERFVGKQAVLGLGYGLGWMKFVLRLMTDSYNQTGTMITLEDHKAQAVVNLYRNEYHEVPKTWRDFNNAGIPALATGTGYTFGPCVFEHQAIVLPNGLKLHYSGLRQVKDAEGKWQWMFTHGGIPKRVYGGKLLENIVQALCRIITMDAALRIQRRLEAAGIWLALQVHDELVYSVPDELVTIVCETLMEEMVKRPTWAPLLPLAAEVGVGASYGDAK